MVIANYHVHSTISDGKWSPEKIIEESIKNGVSHIAFTDHYPLPNDEIAKWDIKFNENDFKEFERLKSDYRRDIKIAIGVEMDWLERHQEYTQREIKKRPYDFVLGSIHFIPLRNKGYKNINEVGTLEGLVSEYGSIQEIVHEYFRQTRLMADSALFDCIGHLDRIKLLCPQATELETYNEEIIRTLDKIKEKDVCTEINTSGYHHLGINETYPSPQILHEMKKREIPITIGTDGHENPNLNLKKGYLVAREAGYYGISIFSQRKRKNLKILKISKRLPEISQV